MRKQTGGMGAHPGVVMAEAARRHFGLTEREAEIFASHFLMPNAVFWRQWRDAAGLALLDRVVKVKRVFRESWRAVLHRVSERVLKENRNRLSRPLAHRPGRCGASTSGHPRLPG